MESTERPLYKNNRGPRSPAGKVAVSRNRARHGLIATAIVLASEDAAAWQSFHEDVVSRLEAEGPVESALASRVAELLWRLRRVARAEEQSVSVSQTHRDTLVYDREQPGAALEPPLVDADAPDAPASREQRRRQITKLYGIYANAMIARSVADRYEETLPVLLPGAGELETIMRYEAHLSRLLKHALHELEALQDRRRGNATPLARIDIS